MKEEKEPVTSYYEQKIGKNLFRVTNVYKGEFELGKALEDLIVRKILREENSPQGTTDGGNAQWQSQRTRMLVSTFASAMKI